MQDADFGPECALWRLIEEISRKDLSVSDLSLQVLFCMHDFGARPRGDQTEKLTTSKLSPTHRPFALGV